MLVVRSEDQVESLIVCGHIEKGQEALLQVELVSQGLCHIQAL